MADQEYQFRRFPLLKQVNEGREGYQNGTHNPYDYKTQSHEYVSWDVGYGNEMGDQCLIDMGR